jgi:hypothetical protein
VRPFKGIFCDDISEFESSHPSHAVGLAVGRVWSWLEMQKENLGLAWGGPEVLPSQGGGPARVPRAGVC